MLGQEIQERDIIGKKEAEQPQPQQEERRDAGGHCMRTLARARVHTHTHTHTRTHARAFICTHVLSCSHTLRARSALHHWRGPQLMRLDTSSPAAQCHSHVCAHTHTPTCTLVCTHTRLCSSGAACISEGPLSVHRASGVRTVLRPASAMPDAGLF